MNHWLVKSEPFKYSWDHFVEEGKSMWDGVSSYEARNNMMAMKAGDLALFYHANVSPPGVAGICRVCSKPIVDYTALDSQSPGYDPKSTVETPISVMIEVEFV